MKFSVISAGAQAVLAVLICHSTNAYNPTSEFNTNANKINASRREAIAKLTSATFASTGLAFLTNKEKAYALEECPAKSNNCVRTTWTPPASTSKESAISTLREVISTYPQEGQANIDGGGWEYAADDFDTKGLGSIVFKSSGKGNLAKFFNGGKPFLDDVKLEVEDTGVVQVKSQSRLGDSDFGVNRKRVDFLAAALKEKGWSI